VTQQTRKLAIQERLTGIRFLLLGCDTKFSGPFDGVFQTEGLRVVRTPIRAPRANAFAERFVRTIRSECLDHMLFYGCGHLERVLSVYVRQLHGAAAAPGVGPGHWRRLLVTDSAGSAKAV
jgi:putative transposase